MPNASFETGSKDAFGVIAFCRQERVPLARIAVASARSM